MAAFATLLAILNTFQFVTQIQSGFVNLSRSPSNLPFKAKFNDDTSNLVWFVHVSDLHFSIFQDHHRSNDFVSLCQLLKDVIVPRAVVLTGDLTDAKAKDKLGSRQFEEEWKIYHDTMEKCGAFQSEPGIQWLDVRGNHDTFNTKSPKEDFYVQYGIGKSQKRTYAKVLKVQNTTYGFVALDATLAPGPKRPFNFFGSLSPAELEEFDYVMKETKRASHLQIVFGHYPTSCVLSPNPGIKSVIGQSSNTLAYLCGHLHTLNGMAPNMYSAQPEGFLELELGDWKDNRIFRILAIDQGQLVFKDFTAIKQADAYALILNPQDMSFVQPKDLSLVHASTHIRVLVFANKPIEELQVLLDDSKAYKLTQKSPNLFTAPWSPSKFKDGQVHQLKVIMNGKTILAESKFSLSPSEELGITGLLAKIVLSFNWSVVTQAVFGLCAVITVLPLSLMRSYPPPKSAIEWRLIRGLAKIAATNSVFYPIVFTSLYISIGPWALGYFLDEELGLLFPWGLLIDGHILPADVTHLYGLFFMFPYIYLLMFTLALKRRKREKESTWLYIVKSNVIFSIVMALQVLHCVEFYLCYGALATILGTCGLGRIIFVFHLWRNSRHLY